MKILINAYVGKKITGIGVNLINIIKNIDNSDTDVNFVIYANKDNKEILDLTNERVKVKKIPITKYSSLQNLLYNIFIFPFVPIFEKVDIVYYTNFMFIPFSLKPLVVVIHDMIEFKVKQKFSKLRMLYRQITVPRMARISDRIITVSHNSKNDIVEICHIDPNKVEIIYNGTSKKEDRGWSPEEEDYLLYVGTIDYPGKNVMNAVKAFEKYNKKHDDNLKFVICGMFGKDSQVVLDYIEASECKSSIVIKGYLEDYKIAGYYKHARAFIFLSYYEGFGLPILEAQQSGVPVIASNASCFPEIIGDSALIADPDDVDKIALCIEKIKNNDGLREDLIKKGYTNTMRFSWKESSRRTIKVLKDLYEESCK